jgi:hypothetical protein
MKAALLEGSSFLMFIRHIEVGAGWSKMAGLVVGYCPSGAFAGEGARAT